MNVILWKEVDLWIPLNLLASRMIKVKSIAPAFELKVFDLKPKIKSDVVKGVQFVGCELGVEI